MSFSTPVNHWLITIRPGVTMRILLSVMMLFCLFLIGCGGTPDMVPEGPETESSTAELSPEEEATEMELQNASEE
jgi:hypothetical protein